MGDDALTRPDRRDPHAPPEGRRAPRTHGGPAGELFLSDEGGRQWVVYDRRVGHRRRPVLGAEAPAPPDAGIPGETPGSHDARLIRAFVAADGETWEYALGPGELLDETPTGLARQLAGATWIDLTRD